VLRFSFSKTTNYLGLNGFGRKSGSTLGIVEIMAVITSLIERIEKVASDE
jgi:hypothetical protein